MKNNRTINKEELNRLKEACLKMSDELAEKYPHKKFTAWDIISKVLADSSGYDVYFLTLKADLDVIKLIAEGLSASSIANRLSIPSQYIFEVAKIWGMCILDYSLDFNPMYVYKDGMSAQELAVHINDILPVPITEAGAKSIINNIEKFRDYVEFLEEYDYEKG